jgi:Transposase DDE domain.
MILPQIPRSMITKVKYDYMSLIYNALSNKAFSKMKQPRKKFIAITLWLFASIKGRINFLQLGRFSSFCEQYFRIGFQKEFDFLTFNKVLLEKRLSSILAIVLDPSYISKFGKWTHGVGSYWSGCAGKAKWGLEICGFAVVDVLSNTAYHLKAFQSPSLKELKAIDSDLLSHYGKLVVENAKHWKEYSQYVLADAYFSKKPFVEQVLSVGMHLISRLRDDADLKYIYTGAQKGGKGRPKQYDGKVKIKEPNMKYFTLEESDEYHQTLSALVYSKALKMKIRVALVIFFNKEGQAVSRKLYFSTDNNLTASMVFKYYRSRFQIEFIYRDAKQHTGLSNCLGRSKEKLDFHFNAALTAVNLAKISNQKEKENQREPFSMADCKNMYNNALLLERFIDKFGINPNSRKNQKIIAELLNFGKIAA